MVLRYWCGLLAGAALSLASLAKAEEHSVSIPVLPVFEEKQSSDKSLDINFGLDQQFPLIDLDTFNRCPQGSVEVPQAPALVTELSAGHPARELVLDVFAGEKSIDPAYDEFRLEVIESKPPVCVRKDAFDFLEGIVLFQEKRYSLLPENVDITRIEGGSSTSIRLEMPGDLHYNLLGDKHNSIEYANGSILYDLKDKNLEAIINGQRKTLHLPQLNLESIFLGGLNFPNFRDQLQTYPNAVMELGNSLELFTDNVIRGMNLALQTGEPTERGIELAFKLRGLFEEILPQYVSDDGVISPEEWEKIEDAVAREITIFQERELSSEESKVLNSEIDLFQEQFTQLRKTYPLIDNSWRIISADDPFSLIKWGGISVADAYSMLSALDPALYELNIGKNEVFFKTKDLQSTLDGYSSNFSELSYGKGRRLIETHHDTIRMAAVGRAELRAILSGGAEVARYWPELFEQELDIVTLILAIDPQFIDLDIGAAAEFACKLRSTRGQGFMTEFVRDNYTLGMTISFGTIYDNFSQGSASFTGSADSDQNLIAADFAGNLTIQQFLRKQQVAGFFLQKETENYWFEARVNTTLEQAVKLSQYWGGTWKFRSTYTAAVRQNAWSYQKSLAREAFATQDVSSSWRGGLNFGMLDLILFTDFEHLGTGFLLNTSKKALYGECSFGDSCLATTRIALDQKLDEKRTKEYFLALQHLKDSPLAGVEALREHEQYLFNIRNPGLFLDFNFKYTFADIFPWDKVAQAQVGLLMAEPHTSGNINLYFGLKYDGDFNDVHGFRIDIGSKYWDSYFSLKSTKDEVRNTNSIQGSAGVTFHLGMIEIMTRHELFPAPLDDEPEYVETDRGYKIKREGDYRALFEVRGIF